VFPPPVTVTLTLPTIKVKVGTGKKAKTKSEKVLQLQFSAPLSGTGNSAAYQLLSSKTKKHVTTFGKAVPLTVSNPSALTVTLIPATALNLSQPEQLRVTAALLTDAYGRHLAGNPNGQPGSDFVAVVSNKGITISSVQSKSRIAPLSASAVDAVFAERWRSGVLDDQGLNPCFFTK